MKCINKEREHILYMCTLRGVESGRLAPWQRLFAHCHNTNYKFVRQWFKTKINLNNISVKYKNNVGKEVFQILTHFLTHSFILMLKKRNLG